MWYSCTATVTAPVIIRADGLTPYYIPALEVRTSAGGHLANNGAFYDMYSPAVGVQLTAGTTCMSGLGGVSRSHNGNATVSLSTQRVTAPQGVQAVAGDRSAAVSWTAAALGTPRSSVVECRRDGMPADWCGSVGPTTTDVTVPTSTPRR